MTTAVVIPNQNVETFQPKTETSVILEQSTTTTEGLIREAAIFENAQLRIDVSENEGPIDLVVVKARYVNDRPGDIVTYTLQNGDPTIFK